MPHVGISGKADTYSDENSAEGYQLKASVDGWFNDGALLGQGTDLELDCEGEDLPGQVAGLISLNSAHRLPALSLLVQ